ncbi:MAG: MBL fold metallo-hydrolase [Spirochaetaceae bacterium]|nr:MBL fold metallo-hydrolase [Spirochaetaceae bacterium]
MEGAAGERIIIDAGPEFRLQAVRAGITQLDALLLTHAHADHLHGLDDVRPLTHQTSLNVYAAAATLNEVKERFPYIFKRGGQQGGGIPRLKLTAADAEPFSVGNLTITPLPVRHGIFEVLGWKFSENGQSAAYITDVNDIPSATNALTADIGVLVIGALRVEPHATHFCFDQALEAAARTGARTVYLTHLCHNHSHAEITAHCERWTAAHHAPFCAAPAWDGLTISI